MTQQSDIDKLIAETMEDFAREAFGLGQKDRKNQAHSTSQYTKHSTALPNDPQERWSQHVDRIKRGKRLTGYGVEIDEEKR